MNVLIIKTGLTETFDPTPASFHIVSFGDVLRTTPLLHLFKNNRVDWFTSSEAAALLENNPLISNLVTDQSSLLNNYDLIINLERSPILKNISAAQFFGFKSENSIVTAIGTHNFFSWLDSDPVKSLNWSEKLFTILGKKWKNEPYVFCPKSQISSKYDLGLNWKVGSKWPSKSWPLKNWEELQSKVENDMSVSWQEGFDNLSEYIAWVQSCKVLLTHDSLGMHLGLAMGKKIIALFGPTRHEDVPLRNAVIICRKELSQLSASTCYQDRFNSKIFCVESFEVNLIETQIRSCLKEYNEQSAVGWK